MYDPPREIELLRAEADSALEQRQPAPDVAFPTAADWQHSPIEAPPDEEAVALREAILGHLERLKLPSWANGHPAHALSKANIRDIHASQRRELLGHESVVLAPKFDHMLQYFASGQDVKPDAIDPELVAVKSDHSSGDLFRFAALLWSVPVSKGYGRRMRYLVRDRSNGKLIGIFGLTDPVFNLRARDEWIGWSVQERRANLVHVMDAHVVGAVPPYSYILGGKLVAALIGSAEVGEAFAARYCDSEGIISKERKAARLALVTVTSALGRSSLYNRLRLRGRADQKGNSPTLVELARVGSTEGYGHFHLSEPLFQRLRQLVASRGHGYADAYQFGKGPNWRIRLSRVGLGMLGLDPDLLRHGIAREVYVMPLASNCREFLCGAADEAYLDRPSLKQIGEAALERWVRPRSARTPEYVAFERSWILDMIAGGEPA